MIFQNGYLLREPELKEVTVDGRPCHKMNNAIAFHTGEKENTIIDIQLWDHTAKFVADNFEKGDPIQISGELRLSRYVSKEGANRKKYYIYVKEVSFVPRKKDMQSALYAASVPEAVKGEICTDDLPF